MSTMASDAAFLSALQPNTSVTTYGLPSDIQVGNGSSMLNETAKARRVQQQVQMRLAEKSTLPRQNGSATQYAMSEQGGSSSVKYQTYNPSFSSKSSYMYSGSRTMGPRVGHRSGFTSQSAAPDMLQFQRMSVGSSGAGGGVGVAGGGGSGFYREDMRIGNYQGNIRQQNQMDPETLSLHSMRQQTLRMNPWMNDGSDGGSLVSDRDATYSRQYTQNTMNGYTSQSQVRQGAGAMTFPPPMRRSLSGTMYRGGMAGGEGEIVQQQSFKGPAHRTISRITNRNRMSMGSTSGTLQQQMSSSGSNYGGGDRVDRGFIASGVSGSQGNMGSLSRAMSIKSIHSVGRGMDIFGGQMEMGASMGNLNGIETLDMVTAVQYLKESDPELQVMGAAYIQHECYSNKEAKTEVRRLKGIADLVGLINSSNTEVQRYATGATRNLIYENMDNKVALIEEGGIPQLVNALKNQDEEVNKNVTGILWNLSSKDTLKEKLAKEVLDDLTDKVLVPLSGSPDSDNSLTASEVDIFQNTTGCLRNLSSVSEKTRQLMRGTHGLVESLVNYIKGAIDDNRRVEEKGVENSMCVLRNLSYQLYSEMSPSTIQRLEGPTREKASGKGEAIGCFTPQSRKAKDSKNQDLTTFAEVARVPKGMEWLWHPEIVEMYKNVLQQCEINSITREAAAGALQNITAGDKRWAGVLSRVALEQQRILPVLVDQLNTSNDSELRSFTGLLRNLSRHAKDKSDLATKLVSHLVAKLPEDPKKGPSSDVVVNICGVLNNLVTATPIAAREITYFDGLPKLRAIKESRDTSAGGTKASKAAATVLSNMFLYKKLHKQYSAKGFSKEDFVAS